jgi:hypothetical protein
MMLRLACLAIFLYGVMGIPWNELGVTGPYYHKAQGVSEDEKKIAERLDD